MKTISMRAGAAGVLLAGAVAATALAAGTPATMPAANPTDAAAANVTVVQQAVPTSKLGGTASSYFYLSNGGGQVKISKTTVRGFTAFQTVTITPPSGETFLQGFATISGGNSGSRLITSTSTKPKTFTIKLSNPGEQGTPGKLTFRIQLIAAPG
jgi:hypothetical protein